VTEWQVVRKDVCPRCGRRMLPGQEDDRQRYCRNLRAEASWLPAGNWFLMAGARPARIPRSKLEPAS
jgi:hypothetical protein